ncbi:MAG: ATP-grasp fold amidoligase family protein, partial [Verrucomicrobiales bacterium]
HTRDLYTRDWVKIQGEFEYPNSDELIPCPAELEDMIHKAELLAQDFPFVRVDLYAVSGRVYFGELTFYPEKGVGRFSPTHLDKKYGNLFCLEGLYKSMSGGLK